MNLQQLVKEEFLLNGAEVICTATEREDIYEVGATYILVDGHNAPFIRDSNGHPRHGNQAQFKSVDITDHDFF